MTDRRTGELEISEAALRVMAAKPSGEVTIQELVKSVPSFVSLTDADMATSSTRPNEAVWEQIVRNIVSHKNTEGNIIADGLAESSARGVLRITEAGRLHVRNRYSLE
jgi:hypothetical protein